MSAVLDEKQPLLIADCANPVKSLGIPEIMRHQHSSSSSVDLPPEMIDVDLKVFRHRKQLDVDVPTQERLDLMPTVVGGAQDVLIGRKGKDLRSLIDRPAP
jgi:hypothetical protein